MAFASAEHSLPIERFHRIVSRSNNCSQTVSVVVDNAKLLPGADNLKENFVVFWIVAPSPRLGSPNDTITFDPASVGPNEIIHWPDVG